jgi:uncharacterized protein YbaA (DUF1428 family)
MTYIDGFVTPVPLAHREAYARMAAAAAPLFRKHGALQVVECWGDDVPHGKTTDYHRAVAATPEETVVFSWIVWPNRAARDAGSAAVMQDAQLHALVDGDIFDMKRMIYGGFQTIVDTNEGE